MTAAFLDENLPDGTRLRPGTKFIKYWKMRNTGTMSWNADTKVRNFLALFFRGGGGGRTLKRPREIFSNRQ